jgi:tRNA-binding EMAP/Myf-like protein
MLYADVEGTSSALMFVLNNQTLVILTLEPRQMRLLGQESEGVALMLFNND